MFDRTEGTLRIDGRKTGRERCVPLPEIALRCLEAYLPVRHNQLEQVGSCAERALLVSRSGERLTGGAISDGIHTISRRAEVPIHSLHQFRHSCDRICWKTHLKPVSRVAIECPVRSWTRVDGGCRVENRIELV
jgi:site-specific recombinase XerD